MRGRIYNLLKTDRNTNLDENVHSKCQIDTSEETLEKPRAAGKTTAEKVAEQFDVSPATVQRDAKRISIIDNLNEGVKKSLGKTVHDAAMADLKRLAGLDLGTQETVARAVRVGQAKTLKDALKSAPAGKSGAKPKDGPDPSELAKKNKTLAHSYRDKLARAICDYHEVCPNRSERDRLVKLVQGVQLW
jgi:hypothetical protein